MSIQPGVGYTFTSSSQGTNMNIETPWYDMDPSGYKPLYPNLVGDKVSASPGTVNRYIPKIGSVYIDADPAPTITITASGYICVKATYEANKFFPRTATIVYEVGTTPPVDTNTESFYPLGKVTMTTVGGMPVYKMAILVEPGNLTVNRLKAGASSATWWWTRV